jgi:hypothetical protein
MAARGRSFPKEPLQFKLQIRCASLARVLPIQPENAAPSYSRTYLLTQLNAAATTKTIENPLLALEIW